MSISEGVMFNKFELLKNFDLTGKFALVTGASGDIGAAIARCLHNFGAHVYISGRDENKLSILGNELGDRYTTKICDISDIEMCNKMLSDIEIIDILVCNAGTTKDQLAIKMSDKDFSDIVTVNLNANFALNREAIKKMSPRRFGRIINISSVVAFSGNVGQANYCASKSGLVGMSKTLALEVARRGITVNVIAPGFIRSNMTDNLPSGIKDQILSKIPLKKMGTPEDIAWLVTFLATPLSSYITGQTFHVNGGMLQV